MEDSFTFKLTVTLLLGEKKPDYSSLILDSGVIRGYVWLVSYFSFNVVCLTSILCCTSSTLCWYFFSWFSTGINLLYFRLTGSPTLCLTSFLITPGASFVGDTGPKVCNCYKFSWLSTELMVFSNESWGDGLLEVIPIAFCKYFGFYYALLMFFDAECFFVIKS